VTYAFTSLRYSLAAVTLPRDFKWHWNMGSAFGEIHSRVGKASFETLDPAEYRKLSQEKKDRAFARVSQQFGARTRSLNLVSEERCFD
jgi:hypothetical protein